MYLDEGALGQEDYPAGWGWKRGGHGVKVGVGAWG